MLVDRFLNLQWSGRLQDFSPRVTAASLAVLLGVAGSFCLVEATIAPQLVQAYETRVDVGLDRRANETYSMMVRRAEQIARAAAQRSFDRDILISQVSVIVIGRNQGAEAPILTLDVSRVQWRNRPDARRWATYYKTASFLLGFDDSSAIISAPVPSAPVQPAPVPTRTPAPTPTPTSPQTPLPPTATPSNSPRATPPTRRVNPTAPTPTQDEERSASPEDQEE